MRRVFHGHAQFFSSLVVVHQINVEGIALNKTENNPPIARYRNAPHALQSAFESVKAVARQVEVSRALRSIQVTKNVRDSANLIGTDLTRVAVVKELQSPATKRPDH
jgi:hypothetical protein